MVLRTVIVILGALLALHDAHARVPTVATSFFRVTSGPMGQPVPNASNWDPTTTRLMNILLRGDASGGPGQGDTIHPIQLAARSDIVAAVVAAGAATGTGTEVADPAAGFNPLGWGTGAPGAVSGVAVAPGARATATVPGAPLAPLPGLLAGLDDALAIRTGWALDPTRVAAVGAYTTWNTTLWFNVSTARLASAGTRPFGVRPPTGLSYQGLFAAVQAGYRMGDTFNGVRDTRGLDPNVIHTRMWRRAAASLDPIADAPWPWAHQPDRDTWALVRTAIATRVVATVGLRRTAGRALSQCEFRFTDPQRCGPGGVDAPPPAAVYTWQPWAMHGPSDCIGVLVQEWVNLPETGNAWRRVESLTLAGTRDAPAMNEWPVFARLDLLRTGWHAKYGVATAVPKPWEGVVLHKLHVYEDCSYLKQTRRQAANTATVLMFPRPPVGSKPPMLYRCTVAVPPEGTPERFANLSVAATAAAAAAAAGTGPISGPGSCVWENAFTRRPGNPSSTIEWVDGEYQCGDRVPLWGKGGAPLPLDFYLLWGRSVGVGTRDNTTVSVFPGENAFRVLDPTITLPNWVLTPRDVAALTNASGPGVAPRTTARPAEFGADAPAWASDLELAWGAWVEQEEVTTAFSDAADALIEGVRQGLAHPAAVGALSVCSNTGGWLACGAGGITPATDLLRVVCPRAVPVANTNASAEDSDSTISTSTSSASTLAPAGVACTYGIAPELAQGWASGTCVNLPGGVVGATTGQSSVCALANPDVTATWNGSVVAPATMANMVAALDAAVAPGGGLQDGPGRSESQAPGNQWWAVPPPVLHPVTGHLRCGVGLGPPGCVTPCGRLTAWVGEVLPTTLSKRWAEVASPAPRCTALTSDLNRNVSCYGQAPALTTPAPGDGTPGDVTSGCNGHGKCWTRAAPDVCVCDLGWAPPYCVECAPGFWGPECKGVCAAPPPTGGPGADPPGPPVVDNAVVTQRTWDPVASTGVFNVSAMCCGSTGPAAAMTLTVESLELVPPGLFTGPGCVANLTRICGLGVPVQGPRAWTALGRACVLPGPGALSLHVVCTPGVAPRLFKALAEQDLVEAGAEVLACPTPYAWANGISSTGQLLHSTAWAADATRGAPAIVTAPTSLGAMASAPAGWQACEAVLGRVAAVVAATATAGLTPGGWVTAGATALEAAWTAAGFPPGLSTALPASWGNTQGGLWAEPGQDCLLAGVNTSASASSAATTAVTDANYTGLSLGARSPVDMATRACAPRAPLHLASLAPWLATGAGLPELVAQAGLTPEATETNGPGAVVSDSPARRCAAVVCNPWMFRAGVGARLAGLTPSASVYRSVVGTLNPVRWGVCSPRGVATWGARWWAPGSAASWCPLREWWRVDPAAPVWTAVPGLVTDPVAPVVASITAASSAFMTALGAAANATALAPSGDTLVGMSTGLRPWFPATASDADGLEGLHGEGFRLVAVDVVGASIVLLSSGAARELLRSLEAMDATAALEETVAGAAAASSALGGTWVASEIQRVHLGSVGYTAAAIMRSVIASLAGAALGLPNTTAAAAGQVPWEWADLGPVPPSGTPQSGDARLMYAAGAALETCVWAGVNRRRANTPTRRAVVRAAILATGAPKTRVGLSRATVALTPCAHWLAWGRPGPAVTNVTGWPGGGSPTRLGGAPLPSFLQLVAHWNGLAVDPVADNQTQEDIDAATAQTVTAAANASTVAGALAGQSQWEAVTDAEGAALAAAAAAGNVTAIMTLWRILEPVVEAVTAVRDAEAAAAATTRVPPEARAVPLPFAPLGHGRISNTWDADLVIAAAYLRPRAGTLLAANTPGVFWGTQVAFAPLFGVTTNAGAILPTSGVRLCDVGTGDDSANPPPACLQWQSSASGSTAGNTVHPGATLGLTPGSEVGCPVGISGGPTPGTASWGRDWTEPNSGTGSGAASGSDAFVPSPRARLLLGTVLGGLSTPRVSPCDPRLVAAMNLLNLPSSVAMEPVRAPAPYFRSLWRFLGSTLGSAAPGVWPAITAALKTGQGGAALPPGLTQVWETAWRVHWDLADGVAVVDAAMETLLSLGSTSVTMEQWGPAAAIAAIALGPEASQQGAGRRQPVPSPGPGKTPVLGPAMAALFSLPEAGSGVADTGTGNTSTTSTEVDFNTYTEDLAVAASGSSWFWNEQVGAFGGGKGRVCGGPKRAKTCVGGGPTCANTAMWQTCKADGGATAAACACRAATGCECRSGSGLDPASGCVACFPGSLLAYGAQGPVCVPDNGCPAPGNATCNGNGVCVVVATGIPNGTAVLQPYTDTAAASAFGVAVSATALQVACVCEEGWSGDACTVATPPSPLSLRVFANLTTLGDPGALAALQPEASPWALSSQGATGSSDATGTPPCTNTPALFVPLRRVLEYVTACEDAAVRSSSAGDACWAALRSADGATGGRAWLAPLNLGGVPTAGPQGDTFACGTEGGTLITAAQWAASGPGRSGWDLYARLWWGALEAMPATTSGVSRGPGGSANLWPPLPALLNASVCIRALDDNGAAATFFAPLHGVLIPATPPVAPSGRQPPVHLLAEAVTRPGASQCAFYGPPVCVFTDCGPGGQRGDSTIFM